MKALTLEELAAKFKAGTLTEAELSESGYEEHQIKQYIDQNGGENITKSKIDPIQDALKMDNDEEAREAI